MPYKKVSEAVKSEAVHQVVHEHQSVPQVCKAMNVGPTALRRWVRAWQGERTPLEPEDANKQRQRVIELEAQVTQLEEERDVLKKSIAFFVRDHDRLTR